VKIQIRSLIFYKREWKIRADPICSSRHFSDFYFVTSVNIQIIYYYHNLFFQIRQIIYNDDNSEEIKMKDF